LQLSCAMDVDEHKHADGEESATLSEPFDAAAAGGGSQQSQPAASSSSNGNGSGSGGLKLPVPQQRLLSVLEQCGLDLRAVVQAGKEGRKGVVELSHPVHFQLELERHLRGLSKKEQQSCVEGLQDLLQSDVLRLSLLHPTVAPSAAPSRLPSMTQQQRAARARADMYFQQPSVVHLLLQESMFQTRMACDLLERTCDMKATHETETGEKIPSTELKLILSALKRLDHLFEPERVASTLKEVLEAAEDVEVQRELVSAIPEIIGDAVPKSLVSCLLDLQRMKSDVTAAVLDTLQRLQLDRVTSTTVVDKLLEELGTAGGDELRPIVSFVVQSCGAQLESSAAGSKRNTKTSVLVTLLKLRDALANSGLKNLSAAMSSSMRNGGQGSRGGGGASQRGGGSRDSGSVAYLVMDTLSSSFRHHPSLGQLWLRMLQSTKDGDEWSVVDVWMLLLLFATPMSAGSGDQDKKIATLVKDKLASKLLTLQLVEQAVTNHQDVLADFFPDLLRLGDLLLRQNDSLSRSAGGKLQSSAFRAFPAPYHRNVIIDQLTKQVSDAKAMHTANAALAELHALVKQDPRALHPSMPHIHALTEYLLRFDDAQLRTVLDIYAMLSLDVQAAPDGGRVMRITQGCSILLRKQLSAALFSMHRVGVLGSVALLKQMASIGKRQADDAAPPLRAKNAMSLFQEHWNELVGELDLLPEASTRLADLFDEMAAAIDCGCLHPDAVEFIKLFMDKRCLGYIFDLSQPHPPLPATEDMQMEIAPWLCLDRDRGHGVDLLPLVLDPKARPRLASLCPSFRLLLSCYRSTHRLEDVSRLLNMPLLLFEPPELLDFEESLTKTTQQCMMTAVFHALNFVREFLGAFSTRAGELKEELSTRLIHHIALYDELTSLANLAADYNLLPLGLPHEQEKLAQERAADLGEELRQRQDKARSQKSKSKAKPKETTNWMDMFDPFLRPMQAHVLRLLTLPLELRDDERQIGLIHKSKTEKLQPGTQPRAPVIKGGTLSATCLRFLLHELHSHAAAAQEHTESPLAACLNRRPAHLDTSFMMDTDEAAAAAAAQASLVSSEQMTPVELVQFLLPVLPHIGAAWSQVVQHSLANPNGVMGADDELYAAPDVLEECVALLVGVLKFLLECKTLLDEPELQQRALMALAQHLPDGGDNEEDGAGPPESPLQMYGRLFALLRSSMAKSCQTMFAAQSEVLRVAEALLGLAKSHKLAPSQLEVMERGVSECAFELLAPEVREKLTLKSLGEVVKAALRHSGDVADACAKMMNRVTGFLDCRPTDKDEHDEEWQSLRLDTLAWYLIPLLEVLTTSLLTVQPKHYASDARGSAQFFRACARFTKLHVHFIDLLQNYSADIKIPVLAATMRWGRQVLEFATKHQDTLDTHMTRTRQVKMEFIEHCQAIRQYLAHCCTHGKTHQESSLTSQSPLVLATSDAFFETLKSLMNKHGMRVDTTTIEARTADGRLLSEYDAGAVDLDKRPKGTSRTRAAAAKRKRRADDDDEEEEEEEEAEEEEEDEAMDGGEEEEEEKRPAKRARGKAGSSARPSRHV